MTQEQPQPLPADVVEQRLATYRAKLEKENPPASTAECLRFAIEALEAVKFDLSALPQRPVDAAQRLCEIYFNIAADVVGEEEVRRRRDAALPPAPSSKQGGGVQPSSVQRISGKPSAWCGG